MTKKQRIKELEAEVLILKARIAMLEAGNPIPDFPSPFYTLPEPPWWYQRDIPTRTSDKTIPVSVSESWYAPRTYNDAH